MPENVGDRFRLDLIDFLGSDEVGVDLRSFAREEAGGIEASGVTRLAREDGGSLLGTQLGQVNVASRDYRVSRELGVLVEDLAVAHACRQRQQYHTRLNHSNRVHHPPASC